jgi:hypothetical protein
MSSGPTRGTAKQHNRKRDGSPDNVNAVRGADLHQQDNRYLHNTLTSEVFERYGDSTNPCGTVDVGVEDLTDLEHLEALDEVRQWEDRIVSQHMVVLQEDARLLTEESELLSQVQQGASYDIDWYVSEVDKVVRRKMDVYAGFLEDLEVFKAQLRREETLSRNCQRNRDAAAIVGWLPDGLAFPGELDGSAPQASPRAELRSECGHMEASPQRMPRTPRVPTDAGVVGMTGGTTGNRGTPDLASSTSQLGGSHEADQLSAHNAALEEANVALRAQADEAIRRVSVLEEEARATAAAKDAHIASLQERIEATSHMVDGVSQDRSWQVGGLAAVQRVWYSG